MKISLTSTGVLKNLEHKLRNELWARRQTSILAESKFFEIFLEGDRVAQSAGIGGLDPSIAKDLIDSEDPKHTQNVQLRHFCRENAQLQHFCRENVQLRHFCRKNM